MILPHRQRTLHGTGGGCRVPRLATPLVLLHLLVVLHPAGLPRAGADEEVRGAEAEQVFFEDQVAALLENRCAGCHNPDDAEGGLDLSTPAALVRGGPSGAILRGGDPAHSLLYEVVHGHEMPPEGDHLEAEEIEQIRAWIAAGAQFRSPPELAGQGPTQHEVLPILLLRCTACHGAELRRGELDLRSITSLQAGGQSGPVARAGEPDGSLMIQRLEQQLCPPKGQLLKYFVERPTTTEIETLRRWIAAGMPHSDAEAAAIRGVPDPLVTDRDRQHWAFEPLPLRVEVPEFPGVELNQPIDAFIYQRLRDRGLDFSPPASRSELIRRVHFNLIGMPPAPQDLEHWQQHRAENWYEQMVDSLLASPHYGQRWGRYWLDVAGYSDSEGGQSVDTVRQFAWKYRDYVIRAFNADKPWDRFLWEQLAGDELADYTIPEQVNDQIVDNLIATGFLRMTVDETGSRTMNFVSERLRLIADTLDIVSTSVLGLTMECARCHSHKYDPIPHSDYFRFKAIFQGALDEHDWMSWKTRKLEVATPEMLAEREATNAPLLQQIAALQKQRRGLIAQHQVDKRPSEAVLVKQHPALAEQLQQIDAEVARCREAMVPPPTIRALWDRGRPSPTYVLIRGEYNRPGRPVGPGVPSVLSDGQTPLDIQPPWPGASSSGRRLAFARWLTEPQQPLTARVLINRMWSHHFGQGIVKTLDNFGAQGAEPTHPELLDWLARQWIEQGWSLKAMHRLILTSRTYQQSSARSEASDRVDPENLLLSRMTLRRLDAEALRDSMLAVSGRLNSRVGGPPSAMTVRSDGLIMETAAADNTFRRSVYLQLRRTEMPTLLSAFDYPEMQPNCHQRGTATVATQALILMNNQAVRELAAGVAQRLLAAQTPTQPALAESAPLSEQRQLSGDSDDAEQVRGAYQIVLSRSPTPLELEEATAALQQLRQLWALAGRDAKTAQTAALATFCHTLLNSAEFVYID